MNKEDILLLVDKLYVVLGVEAKVEEVSNNE